MLKEKLCNSFEVKPLTSLMAIGLLLSYFTFSYSLNFRWQIGHRRSSASPQFVTSHPLWASTILPKVSSDWINNTGITEKLVLGYPFNYFSLETPAIFMHLISQKSKEPFICFQWRLFSRSFKNAHPRHSSATTIIGSMITRKLFKAPFIVLKSVS